MYFTQGQTKMCVVYYLQCNFYSVVTGTLVWEGLKGQGVDTFAGRGCPGVDSLRFAAGRREDALAQNMAKATPQ